MVDSDLGYKIVTAMSLTLLSMTIFVIAYIVSKDEDVIDAPNDFIVMLTRFALETALLAPVILIWGKTIAFICFLVITTLIVIAHRDISSKVSQTNGKLFFLLIKDAIVNGIKLALRR